MNGTTLDQPTHPILGFARALDGALDRVSVVSPVFMSADDKRAALVALTREQHRLEALRLRVIAAADRRGCGGRVHLDRGVVVPPHPRLHRAKVDTVEATGTGRRRQGA